MQGLNAAVTATTLRMKGVLKTGSQTTTIQAQHFTLAGNPFASAIDFGQLTKTNVANTMYLWDPRLAGNYGVGGYVTVSWNSVTGTYDKTGSVSALSQKVAAGDAFFVRTADGTNPGTLTIKEADKVVADIAARPYRTDQKISVELYLQKPDTAYLLDAVLNTFDNSNQNEIDTDDAIKMANSGEGIALQRAGILLSIERRKEIEAADTMFLNLSRLKTQRYKLRITTENLSSSIAGFVLDKYLGTINTAVLDLMQPTDVYFSVTADPGSYAADRFSIVFEQVRPLPVTFTSVKASLQQKNIDVLWNVENESGMKYYEVETMGREAFTAVAAIDAGTGNAGHYHWLDVNATPGNHFYRIKSIAGDLSFSYSPIVKVTVPAANDISSLAVFPNPVKGNMISLQIRGVSKGVYHIQVVNVQGQVVKTFLLQHQQETAVYTLPLGASIPKGNYQLTMHGADNNYSTALLID